MSEFSSERILKTDYSQSFDEKRKGLVIQSYFKYGKEMSINYILRSIIGQL